jgi:dsRNA-specific ribonuclease
MNDNEQPGAIEVLEERIGYPFKNKELIRNALTHYIAHPPLLHG